MKVYEQLFNDLLEKIQEMWDLERAGDSSFFDARSTLDLEYHDQMIDEGNWYWDLAAALWREIDVEVQQRYIDCSPKVARQGREGFWRMVRQNIE